MIDLSEHPIVDLVDGQCKWPFDGAPTRFCCDKTSLGSVYCATHHLIAYTGQRRNEPARRPGSSRRFIMENIDA